MEELEGSEDILLKTMHFYFMCILLMCMSVYQVQAALRRAEKASDIRGLEL